MRNNKLSTWDTSKYLDSEDAIAEYLHIVLEENDLEHLNIALRNVAKARGMTQLAKEAGLTRAGLYKALSDDGNPTVSTLQKILAAFNLRLSVESIPAK
jgi:probable addiction module antidote protein